MTDPHVPPAAPPRRPSSFPAILLGLSLAFNLLVLVVILFVCAGFVAAFRSTGQDTTGSLSERYHSGKKSASDKVAVVAIDGVIMEGLNGFAEKQIDQAARDKNVKAVVVQINSPGGTITGSDDLYHRLTLLRDGDPEKGTGPKPLVVSMASVAASGGYYIAMPGQVIYAERSTMTGSIGVYASFPDLTGLSDKIGVDMTYIKRGAVKASGNPFRKLSPEEYAVWDEMVGQSYDQFLAVVKKGRGDKLKADLTSKVIDEERTFSFTEKDPKTQESITERKKVHYTRELADGGVWMPEQALKFGLIDKIGYLGDAIKEAHDLAGLGDNWKAISYEPPSLLARLLEGGGTQESVRGLDAAKLADATTPRLWYLMPQAEMSGILKAAGR